MNGTNARQSGTTDTRVAALQHDQSSAKNALAVGTACYLFSSVFWGMNIPFTAVLFKTFDPFFLSWVRVVIAMVLLGTIAWASHGSRALHIPLAAPRFAMLTLTMAAFFTFYNLGLRYTNPITAAALMAGTPVYAAITMRLVTGTPLERGFHGAALLTIIGASIAIYGRGSASGQGLSLQGGEIFVIASLVSWTLYSIFAQRWFPRNTPQIQRTFVSMTGTSVWLAISWAVFYRLDMAGGPKVSPDSQAMLFLFATAILATGLGGVTWNIGVNRIGLMPGSVWQNTVPVFGVLIALPFGFVPTGEQILGGIIVLSGVLYMQWHKLRTAIR
jgi:drug/metabolite transporter (DMT)-like permease